MIEITVMEFLSNSLGVPVHMEYPEKPTDRFLVLRRTDNKPENHIYTATFVAESYAETMLEAAKLNGLAINALDRLTELDGVTASRHVTDYEFKDTKNKRYRYQAVYNLTYY